MAERKFIEDANEIRLNDRHEIDQILGNPPGWILKWGLTLLFFAVIIFGMISWWIKYPDVISARVMITTENPAIRIPARTSGKIEHLLVNNNASVSENELIAVLHNPAVLEDVQAVKSFIKKVNNASFINNFLRLPSNENLSLGNLQNTYEGLVQKLKDYQHFSAQTGTLGKINSIEEQIKYLNALNTNIENQKSTLEEEISLSLKDYERNIRLNEIGETADAELEKSKTEYLRYKRQIEDLKNQILNNNINISGLKTQIIELKENRTGGSYDKELAIREDIQKLKSEVKAWEQTYLITAPIPGTVSFSKAWSEQQFININEEIATIVPNSGAGKIVGKVLLPVANSGKVSPGQTANIQLDGFPYQEYGILKSEITGISLVPYENTYLVELNLTDGLKTTYKKTIPFRQEMQGNAKIITEDRRVLERIFDRINSILKNN